MPETAFSNQNTARPHISSDRPLSTSLKYLGQVESISVYFPSRLAKVLEADMMLAVATLKEAEAAGLVAEVAKGTWMRSPRSKTDTHHGNLAFLPSRLTTQGTSFHSFLKSVGACKRLVFKIQCGRFQCPLDPPPPFGGENTL